MGNIKTVIDKWAVQDLEDNSLSNVLVHSCTELGNYSLPGIQVHTLGNIVNYEPNIVGQWANKASKEGKTEYLLEEKSWMYEDDQYVKYYLVIGNPMKAKVIVKTRSSPPVSKEYDLPFELQM